MQVKLGILVGLTLGLYLPLACSSGSGGGSVLMTGSAGAGDAAGDTGPSTGTGAAGTQSTAGTSGDAGTTGRAGAGGSAPSSGTAGANGGAGTTGSAGTTGGAGTTGSAGATGNAGASATGSAGSGAGGVVGAGETPPDGSGGAGAEVAHIRETASTNTPEINVSVYADASAVRQVGAGSYQYVADKSYAAGAADVVAFLAELQLVGDVSAIPTATDCAKSASFGTRTIVTAGGTTSGDLQCLLAAATDADYDLALDARKLDGTIQ